MTLLRQIHRWAGIVLAALLIVIALSGAVAAFRGDFVRAALPAARGAPVTPAQLGPGLDRFAAAHPDVLVSAKLAPYDLPLSAAFLQGGERAWVDADGQVAERWRGTRGIGEWALQLHHKLLLGETGEIITGVVGIAALLMVVSGLIVYWPLRRGFSWRLWPASGKRLALLKSHRNLALVLALPLLLQFTSGAAMVFEKSIGKLPGFAMPKAPTVTAAGPANWSAIIAVAQGATPGGTVRAVAAPRSPDRPYSVNVQQPGDINPEGATRVFVAGGEVVGIADPAQHGAGPRLLTSMMGVHTLNYIGGLPAQLLLALLGVLLAAVAAMGGLAWLRSPRRSSVKG